MVGKSKFIISQEEMCHVAENYYRNLMWNDMKGNSVVVKVRQSHEKGQPFIIYWEEKKK